MIDKRAGTIQLENSSLKIYRGLTEKEFLESTVGKQASVSVQNYPYTTYRVPLLVLLNKEWGGIMSFNRGVLELCSLGLKYGNGWNDYSIEAENALLKEYEDILIHAVGQTSYSGRWGSVSAAFNLKDQTSSISIRACFKISWKKCYSQIWLEIARDIRKTEGISHGR